MVMAMMRTLSTLMPAALATVRFWPTARNCWPRRVRISTTLNRHSSATMPKVAIGTLTMENRLFITGSCMSTQTTASAPSWMPSFLASLRWLRTWPMTRPVAITSAKTSTAWETGSCQSFSSVPPMPPVLDRSMVFAMPEEPLMVRFGLLMGMMLSKMNRHSS